MQPFDTYVERIAHIEEISWFVGLAPCENYVPLIYTTQISTECKNGANINGNQFYEAAIGTGNYNFITAKWAANEKGGAKSR